MPAPVRMRRMSKFLLDVSYKISGLEECGKWMVENDETKANVILDDSVYIFNAITTNDDLLNRVHGSSILSEEEEDHLGQGGGGKSLQVHGKAEDLRKNVSACKSCGSFAEFFADDPQKRSEDLDQEDFSPQLFYV
ncbi:hypothetical protein V9T40_001642 [Parthenolecanium corni]|uniref:Uncharacterized protein n=1 Tax=Parthenolecanium corni TaxID=536013 RepID=A0AAN9TWI3_9HEMI